MSSVVVAAKEKALLTVQFLESHSDELSAAITVALQKHAGLPGAAGTYAAELAVKELLNFARVRSVVHVEAGTYTVQDNRKDAP